MSPIPRSEILKRMNAIVQARKPVVGCGAGTGISAKFAEAGGADLIIIYNSGRYRMAGRGSAAGLLAYRQIRLRRTRLVWLDRAGKEIGAAGIGQSSWGPTGFAIFASETGAFQALRDLRAVYADDAGLDFVLCRARNVPAVVRMDAVVSGKSGRR